jgi:spore coat polysaccharide biosynthesis protein SpsF (cytidylyltransferase family)
MAVKVENTREYPESHIVRIVWINEDNPFITEDLLEFNVSAYTRSD